jgi:alpha-N-arabinofuranosidase
MNPREASGRILTGETVDAHNSFASPSRIAPKAYRASAAGGQLRFELPAKSIAVVQVR